MTQGNVLMNNADGRSPEEAAAAAARAAAVAAGEAEPGDEAPAMHLGMIMVRPAAPSRGGRRESP
jgi:hypothetical protein